MRTASAVPPRCKHSVRASCGRNEGVAPPSRAPALTDPAYSGRRDARYRPVLREQLSQSLLRPSVSESRQHFAQIRPRIVPGELPVISSDRDPSQCRSAAVLSKGRRPSSRNRSSMQTQALPAAAVADRVGDHAHRLLGGALHPSRARDGRGRPRAPGRPRSSGCRAALLAGLGLIADDT
jgi:hypothetical protein